MGWFSSLVGGIVGFVVGGPVGAVIGAGIGATKVGEKVVNTVLDFVLQPFMPSIPDMGAGGEAERQQGVLIQRQGSVEQIPVVYGYRKVGGVISFAETGSTNNRYLYVAYVFSEGLVEGLREVYIDDWLLPVDQVGQLNAGNLVTVNADRYKDRVQLRWYPGVYFSNPRVSNIGSTVKADIFAGAPTFTSDMVYNGLAVLFARYEWKEIKTQADADANPFSGNIPEVKVAMLGKRVASLLVDSTETIPYDANTVRYSTNPAEILLDYLRNPRYGKGLTNNDIDWTTWKQAARKCNQTVTYVASGIQGPILTLNEVVNTDSTIMSNVKSLLQNFRAYMPYVQGKYKLRIEDAGNDTDILSGVATIVQTFTKDDIVSDITYTGIDKSSKYNVISVTYVDPDQKFSTQTVVYPETESERQIYIDRDGGRENKYEVTLGGITNYAIAKDMARLIFNKQRRQESCVFTATSRALELEPGDNIRIQSNILNFGTDPWRVVSIKINNNMTVDLGCVRNPDDIYPYVRVGEEDIVLPTYVPKGSIIYFPSSTNLPPLGLVPPLYAVFPPAVAPVITNPPATNPTDPGGGGVGGGPDGGPTVTEPTTPPTVEVPPTNVTPTQPPPPPPFLAALSLNSVSVKKFDNNNSYFTLKFRQPDDGLYSYSKLWWRVNRYDAWKSVDLTDRGSAGFEIIWSPATPLPNIGDYEFYVRSFATDGRPSLSVTRGNFRAQTSAAQLGEIIGVGSGAIEAITEGWTLPPSDVPTSPWYDDIIDELTIEPLLVAGVPQATRRMKVTMTQLTYTANRKLNYDIVGLRVYYKQKDETYWQYEDLPIAANTPPYTFQSWNLAGDFGPRVYPNPIYPNTTDDGLQTYDFNVRLLYRDKTTAKYHTVGRGLVEQFGAGAYNFVSFGLGDPALRQSSPNAKQELIPANYVLQDIYADQGASFANAQAMIPQIFSCFPDSTRSRILFRFVKPGISSFRGFDIRWRPVVPGASPVYNTVNTGWLLEATTNNIFFVLEHPNYSHSTKYQWQIVAKYSDGTGTHKDSTNCLFTEGSVPFGLAGSQPLVPAYLNFEVKDSKVVLGEITTAFPAVKTLFANRWIKKQLTSNGSNEIRSNGDNFDINVISGTPRLNAWYQLEFQAPNDTFSDLVVYRRFFNAFGANRSSAGQFAKYYPLGAWEKVEIPRTTGMTKNATTGFYTVNIRGPLSYNLFAAYYQVLAQYETLYEGYYGPSPATFPEYSSVFLTDIYPYYGVGNKNDRGASGYAEFLFVLKEGGSEGAKGLRLTEFYTDTRNTSGQFKPEIDGIQTANIPKDEFVTLSDYNGFDNGFKRNLNEAITGIDIDDLANNKFFASPDGASIPAFDSNYSTISFRLANPVGYTSGSTKVW